MNKAMRPDLIGDDARLAALAAFDVLDTPPERGFDDRMFSLSSNTSPRASIFGYSA